MFQEDREGWRRSFRSRLHATRRVYPEHWAIVAIVLIAYVVAGAALIR